MGRVWTISSLHQGESCCLVTLPVSIAPRPVARPLAQRRLRLRNIVSVSACADMAENLGKSAAV